LKKNIPQQTRNKLREHIKSLKFDELNFELNDVNKELIKARHIISKKGNPYEAGAFNPKMLKYKKCLILNRLNEITRYGK